MANEEFLKRVVKRIERDQEHWNQNNWALFVDPSNQLQHELNKPDLTNAQVTFLGVRNQEIFEFGDGTEVSCGTSFCLAGHAVLEAGAKMLLYSGSDHASLCLTPEGDIQSIQRYAKELLGLSRKEEPIFAAAESILMEMTTPDHDCSYENGSPDECVTCDNVLADAVAGNKLTLEQFKEYITLKTGVEFN